MQIYNNAKEISTRIKELKREGHTIGLVPTMGALHAGHISLIQQARSCDVVVASIFVNPLQFNRQDDLDAYPRNIEADIKALEPFCDILFIPTVQEMYPESPVVKIDFGDMANRLEGEFRPGHFNGVGVVVSKLFNLLSPDKAYFGLKDLQQFLLIKQMARDFSMPVSVIGCPIIRESSGLAMSSRNLRLSQKGLEISSHFYQGLQLAKEYYQKNTSLLETKNAIRSYYTSISGITMEYFEFVNEQMDVLEQFDNSKTISACVAGYVDGVRLIDNLYLRTEN